MLGYFDNLAEELLKEHKIKTYMVYNPHVHTYNVIFTDKNSKKYIYSKVIVDLKNSDISKMFEDAKEYFGV